MNNSQPRVTTKKLEVYLKQNLAGEEIATKLGFSSLQEMEEAMKKFFSAHAYEYYRSRLEKKSSKKSSKKKAVSDAIQEPAYVETEEDTRLTLEELCKLENLQQTATIDCEVAVKAIRQKARDNLKSIKDVKDKVDEWQVKINEALAEIDTLEDQAISILVEHEEALNKLHESQKSLQEIRDQIEARSVIFILVDGAAGIEAEKDNQPFELEFGDWRPIYEELIAQDPEILGDLKVSEMVLIAKVLSLPDGNYDITFASTNMETLYESMKNVIK